MAIAVIVYHKNAGTLYPKLWIDEFRSSILNQTYKEFDILEFNYGGSEYRIFDSLFISKPLDNFVLAMNELIGLARNTGYDYIFNTNCDDWYSTKRIELQLPLLKTSDVVSSNFCLQKDNMIYHYHDFKGKDIGKELSKDHNIVSHPSVAFRSSFFDDFQYDPDEIPLEDLKLWQRAIRYKKFAIVYENLLYHRIHSNAVCRSENR